MTDPNDRRGDSRRILIVEDEKLFADALGKVLKKAGFDCEQAGCLKEAERNFRNAEPDLVLTDVRLPDGSGLDFLRRLRGKFGSEIPTLVMSAYGELEDAVEAMRLGAVDYLKKPFDLDELVPKIEGLFSREAITRKLAYSSKREQHTAETPELLGDSPDMQAVRKQIARIAELTRNATPPLPTVLISGETGTGKDLAARLLHAQSGLGDRPFVHVDCASLPKDLIEAELFGHEKGAFTDAKIARTGLIEASEDGVLFLDEIGEVPLELQTKLLAVLERRTLRRVGTTRERPVGAWFIAATNRALESMIMAKTFRSDLYFRLNVLGLHMPSLHERGKDVIILARHFSAWTTRRYGMPEKRFSPAAEQALLAYRWPGNVREVKHTIERAVLLSDRIIDLPQLGLGKTAVEPPSPSTENASPEQLAERLIEHIGKEEGNALETMERLLIEAALKNANHNVSRAAESLGVSRMTMRYRIGKYNLKAD